ncbi:MAG: universal stress protein, partial [Alphaproteobacteria bacterium]|nr:universal stress protein [Alphaproteobacteria bacterium]
MDDTERPYVPPNRRKFLVVVDQTPECRVALRFAARRAQHTGGIVTLLYVVPPADFQQWAGVERLMREEAHEEAERALHDAAKSVNEIVGTMPELVAKEGRPADEIREILKDDRAISILVLAAGTSKEGPGPLVSLIASPSATAYPIP